jgi:predicted TIM-barrel fold metal-dependent hydrolase
MTASIALLGERTRREVWPGPVIDVDVHAVWPSFEPIFERLAPVWQQYVRERGWRGPTNVYTYPPGLPSSARDEWRPADAHVPAASSVAMLREHILDPWDVDYAILNCYAGLDAGHPDASAAIVSATNDWLIEEWLDKDSRLRASIVLGLRDPQAMIREIERVGDHPGFVQVLMPVRSGRLYGNRLFHHVYEVMAKHDLVFGLHWGGSNDGLASTPSGFPSWYAEECVAEQQLFEAQLTSMIAHGVFQAVPDLRVSVLEVGFLWIPAWFWRADKEWKGMRREIPWVDRSPFELLREHMRFSVAPMDLGPVQEVARIIEWLGSEELLMFATDYPHFHDDDLATLLAATPETMQPKLMSESAREWYRL